MSPEPDLVRDLLKPRAYGGALVQGVSLRTTHASWVFLTDGDVWKVKRPVDFGFLDFRTLEARRRVCEDEVRLNRRLAPGVYLGVEPVRSSPDGLSLQGAGPIVDWAVHMRRLPDDANAEAMLARGAARPDAWRRWRGGWRPSWRARATPELAGREVLRANVDENFAQVAPFVGDLVDRATFDDVRAFQRGALGRTRRSLRRARRRGAHPRRPRRSPAGARLFPARRRRHRRDRLHRVQRTFPLRRRGGRGGVPGHGAGGSAVPGSGRWLPGAVRGGERRLRALRRRRLLPVLSGLGPGQGGGVPGGRCRPRRRRFARASATRRAASSRSRARSRGAPVDAPFVVAVGGIVGSGKSTLAAALGRQLAAPVVSSDRDAQGAGGDGADGTRRRRACTRPRRSTETTPRSWPRRRVLASGRGVILDATFSTRRWRGRPPRSWRAGAGARFAFLEACCADGAVLRARLAARRGRPSVSDATDAELDEIQRRQEPVGADEAGLHASIDTSREPAHALASALRALVEAGVHPAAARRAS